MTPELARRVLDDAEAVVRGQVDVPEVSIARELFEEVTMAEGFVEFLTIPAYERL